MNREKCKCNKSKESKPIHFGPIETGMKSVSSATRRRRRCERHALELNYNESDFIDSIDPFPVTPITPPAAFLSTDCKHVRKKGEIPPRKKHVQDFG